MLLFYCETGPGARTEAGAAARSKLEKAQQKVDTAKTELQNAQKALKEAEDNYKNRGGAKGKTTIYAYAQNGVFQKIAVTVK